MTDEEKNKAVEQLLNKITGGKMADVVNLNSARALRNGDANQWTVRDALADVIRAIDAKEIDPARCIICAYQEMPDGSDISVVCAGVNHLEAVGLAHNMISVLTAEDY